MSDAKQREAELMFLRAENQHLKSNNKELRNKIRSISQEKKEESRAMAAQADSDDSQEILFVTSAVKKQVLSQ